MGNAFQLHQKITTYLSPVHEKAYKLMSSREKFMRIGAGALGGAILAGAPGSLLGAGATVAVMTTTKQLRKYNAIQKHQSQIQRYKRRMSGHALTDQQRRFYQNRILLHQQMIKDLQNE